MNKPVRVAVIGAGGWGYQHARAFSSRRDTVLISITGRTEERTRRRVEEFGVPYYLNISEMLEKDKPDLVSICMPGQGTFQPTMEVIRAGVPLLVEKPLVYKLDEAETMQSVHWIDLNHKSFG
ncbi:MAG: Gfo/Idh/MocA family oxidoreductase [Clostridia bacterium]|nr:Gfo/Idh/MocA family oxidoreductase [Clostridia bacterium]